MIKNRVCFSDTGTFDDPERHGFSWVPCLTIMFLLIDNM